LATSWRRSLAARRVSSATIDTYGIAVAQLAPFLHDRGMPEKVGAIRLVDVWRPSCSMCSRVAPERQTSRL
jgi:hypothetical protein